MVELAILGAGASGLMAANAAAAALAGSGASLVVLEGNPKPGKKLLATGNGRCNLTNLEISPRRYHGDALAGEVLKRYPAGRILEEFEGLGLLCRADGEGRVYPNGNQAAAVLHALMRGLGGCIREFPVAAVERTRKGFRLASKDGQVLEAKRLILACGGMASPAHSMGGAGYELAKSLGHTVTELSPSLVPLKTPERACRSLKGMRAKARASLYAGGRRLAAESGEVIFGDGQLSGICIFNLSAAWREKGPGPAQVGLDLLENWALGDFLAYLQRLRREHPQLPAGELFSGALNLRVGQELAKAAGLERDRPLEALTPSQLERAAKLAKDWRFPVTGPGAWADAQVTAGGVPLSQVDPNTMASKLCPGLYLAGELLDVDGDCGGYNLHWAWATGLIAGKAAGLGLPGTKREA